jgi:hypothetical protein
MFLHGRMVPRDGIPSLPDRLDDDLMAMHNAISKAIKEHNERIAGVPRPSKDFGFGMHYHHCEVCQADLAGEGKMKLCPCRDVYYCGFVVLVMRFPRSIILLAVWNAKMLTGSVTNVRAGIARRTRS